MQIAPPGGFVIVGPDGTRAVLQNAADPDFCAYLDADNGLTGLLDSADVRESRDNRVEGHGAVQGNNWLAGRSGTIQGIIIPEPDMATYNAREQKLKRATRGLSAASPSVMTWTPDGSVQRRILLYRQGRFTTSGRRPKAFAVAMSSPDAYIYSADEQSQVITPAGTSSGGFSSPLRSPLTSVYSQAAQSYVLNQGDAETWPRLVIQGPISNPTLLNNSTGLSWTLSYTLAAGETLTVDSAKRTVVFGASTNRFSAYAANFSANAWWSLLAGTNDIRLLSASFATGAQVTVYFRHAWE